MSVFEVFLVRIFPQRDWKNIFFLICPNAGKFDTFHAVNIDDEPKMFSLLFKCTLCKVAQFLEVSTIQGKDIAKISLKKRNCRYYSLENCFLEKISPPPKKKNKTNPSRKNFPAKLPTWKKSPMGKPHTYPTTHQKIFMFCFCDFLSCFWFSFMWYLKILLHSQLIFSLIGGLFKQNFVIHRFNILV